MSSTDINQTMSNMSLDSASTEWPAKRVRQTFVEYFEKQCSHTPYASSPVVPHDDPTLLFANAGMNQFKPIFLGQADPNGPLANLKRAANSQKCIRAGGKHNDLDDVGKDTYHHTFFEMLGNWSFGDYFKEEAITWAWTLLTEVYGLPKDRLYATYFAGDATFGLPADEEARNIWLRYLPSERILPFDKKANFWEMGDTGPCGPCSEIHFDRIGGRDAAPMVNYDDPTVIEIWNIVFMQFNREPDGSLRELPAKHIDTGMGFERLTSILQNKMSNYDTDIFAPLFEAIQKITGAAPYTGKLGAEDTGTKDMAYRVVADHARTLTFAITDGAVPSNEGRGYVLRRILRRAVRYGQQMLGAKPGFFASLIQVVVNTFGEAFPELKAKSTFVQEVIADEEDSFGRTLANGIKTFNKFAATAKTENRTTIQGSEAFFLYDSMGFPLDLTQIMASEANMVVDVDGFQKCMAEQKARARAAGKFGKANEKLVLEAEETSFLAKKGIVPTEDSAKYATHAAPVATVQAIYTLKGFIGDEEYAKAAEGETVTTYGIVMDTTSFYAESGGQVSDTGVLTVVTGDVNSESAATNGISFGVDDVQVFGGFVLHIGTVRSEDSASAPGLKVGDKVRCSVDYERRGFVAPNHTMTHVLNFALREVIGDGADQKGSVVQADKLRFDFASTKGLTPDQIEQVENIVNAQIDKALPVQIEVIPLAKARSLATLRAVFGEAYPDPVRVVAVGPQTIPQLLADPENADWMNLSVELCGGTHLKNTSQAGKFAIIEEGSIAKGIRRIIGVTRDAATTAHGRAAQLATDFAAARSMSGAALDARITELKIQVDAAEIPVYQKARFRDQITELGKRIVAEQKAVAAKLGETGKAVAFEAISKATNKAVVCEVPIQGNSDAVKAITEGIKKTHPDVAFLGISTDATSKTLVFAVVPKEGVAAGIKAAEWVQAAINPIGGRCGGKDDSAMTTVKEVSKTSEVVSAGKTYAEGKY